jgi:hypothetical protein
MARLARAAQPAHDPGPERAHRVDVSDAPGIERRNDGLELRLRLLLSSGGDERIWPDPLTGRSRQATTIAPAPEETWFSSSTASTITELGYRAALADLQALLGRGAKNSVQVHDWMCNVRAELLALYGRAGAEAVLAASGTDAELIALAIAERLLARPITNIVVAPNETGSGVPKAAAGLNFLATSCLGGPVPIGQPLKGWAGADIEVQSVDIRTPDGEPRDAGAVDLDVAKHAERALARGRGVLLHVLDTSKTGLTGPSRRAAVEIAALAPERVHVLVDACQLRCPADLLRSDLDHGFMVLITGSKFAGGPPLSGALLLPEVIATGLRNAPLPPDGLGDYSARLDWPERLQTTFARDLTTTANLGVGLRWTAALAELRRFATVDQRLQERFFGRFEREVRLRASMTPCVAPLGDAAHGTVTNPSIVPLAVRRAGGEFMSAAEVAKVHVAMREAITNSETQGAASRLRRIIHVGQPVQLGPRAVLRVCASAPQINSVAEQVAQGAAFEDAFAPISHDLQALFAKLGDVLSGECA